MFPLFFLVTLMTLSTLLQSRLREQQDMPFVDFMQMALYHPEFGYYSAGLPKFGPQGDFITAPELTPLFGQALANQCQEILTQVTEPVLLEFGAGSGRLCVDLLRRLEQLDCLPERYLILDVSAHLRQRQKDLIEAEIPHLASRVNWLDRWPTQAFNGVLLANEVLDAMPVHRFLQREDGLYESIIRLDGNGQPEEAFRPVTDPRLAQHVRDKLPELPTPYLSEANLFLDGWMAETAALLTRGAMLLIDYGFPRAEYYHPDRNQGTLMCHHRHRAHTNPLAHPGEEDITAHVDFTQVAEAADAAGWQVAGYTSQAAFLLANGLLNLLEDVTDARERIKAQQAVKQLLQPTEMGELFKVIALTKALDTPLTGFQWHDKRASL